ncbi:MAG: type I-E CRISPR-associated protein Cse1/CasA [Chloroflexi bacterium]|nr:type I-E CRISPR-associated protein Cse1/CasA [Chloroflexota bacterium]
MAHFDLVYEPWIPCLRAVDGRSEELGLLAVLARAHELREISDPSPLVTITLHRLLLAILHRVLDGPRSPQAWWDLWNQGRFDHARFEAYFRRWSERFDLFHPEYPFYQTAGLPEEKSQVSAKLTPEVASPGNAVLLFDHTLDSALTPAEAARALIAYHAFAVGGLVTYLPGEEKHRSAKAGPLTGSAVALVRGPTLFHTLLLNLHRYDPEDDVPCPADPDDAPCWEQDDPVIPADRSPRGYLDYLTWQSRRSRLIPTVDADGHIFVRQAVILKGFQFPDGFEQPGVETMVAFVKNPAARKGGDPWKPIGFNPERAIWRDSLALMQSIAGQSQRPKMLSWLSDLIVEGYLERHEVLPLDLFGMVTDQANILLWRQERLPLPLSYLQDSELIRVLGDALGLAEETARSLYAASRELAELLEAPGSDHPNARQPSREAVSTRVRSLAMETRYWSYLEAAFHTLLVELPADRAESHGEVTYGCQALPAWAREVRQAALTAFAAGSEGLMTVPRTTKAVARAENTLRAALRRIHRPYMPKDEPSAGEISPARPGSAGADLAAVPTEIVTEELV